MPSSPASEDDETRAPGSGAQVTEPPGREDAPEPAPGEAAEELARLEDRYKRALADLDNYRKRAGREVERGVQEAREALLRDWLEAVDSVERALRMDPESPVSAGLRPVLEQMEAILARQGVHRIGAPGEPFDPERHEAVAVRASEEAPDGTVLEVVRSGFMLGDRVLRAAQVVVARRPPRD